MQFCQLIFQHSLKKESLVALDTGGDLWLLISTKPVPLAKKKKG